jgi:hypothetical protein
MVPIASGMLFPVTDQIEFPDEARVSALASSYLESRHETVSPQGSAWLVVAGVSICNASIGFVYTSNLLKYLGRYKSLGNDNANARCMMAIGLLYRVPWRVCAGADGNER